MEGFGGDLFLKICGAAILCVVATAVLSEIGRGGKLPIRLCGPILLYGGVLLLLIPLIERLRALSEGYALAAYGEVMLKALGIALLAQIVSDLCRDGGESTVASIVEMAGKAVILLLALPLVESLLETVKALL